MNFSFSARTLWICLLLGLLIGCSRSYADPATVAAGLDPAAVYAQLSPSATLPAAAEQFAVALNIDPAAVRVRLQPGNCLVCTLESRPELSKVEGLSVAEAMEVVEPNDKVTLFVSKFSCIFERTDTKLMPRSCQPSPI
jgi:hypothetical protein